MGDYDWEEPDDFPEAFHADFEVPSASYDTDPLIEVDEEHGLVRIMADDERDDAEHIHKIANFIDYSVRKNHKQVGGSSGSLLMGAAGYAVGGIFGAAAGYLLGAKKPKDVCTQLDVCLYFSDGVKSERLSLIEEWEQLVGIEYQDRLDALKECVSVLEAFKAVNNGAEDVSDVDLERIASEIRETLDE